MKNKRVKLDSESDAETFVVAVAKKKKVKGVSNAKLLKSEKIIIQKKIAGFSQESIDQSDLLSDIPSTTSHISFKTNPQLEEIDLYKEYKEKVMQERDNAKKRFLLEIPITKR